MNIILWVFLAILVFTLIVVIHELWHFLAARFFWVKVLEFWIWIPPRIKKLFTDKKWTKYTLNYLPIWWFVKMKWETLSLKKEYSNDNLNSKPIYQQIIIMLGWVFMNFVLAIALLTWLFYTWIKPITILDNISKDNSFKLESLLMSTQNYIKENNLVIKDWVLISPIEHTLAFTSWIKWFDKVISVWLNNKEIKTPEEFINYIKLNSNKNWFLYIKVRHQDKTIEFIKIDKTKIKDNKIWVRVQSDLKFKEYNFDLITSFKKATKETYVQSRLLLHMLNKIVKNIFVPKEKNDRQEAISKLWWPVAIWWVFVNLVENKSSISFIVLISALISINLGVFNLLPIPALDWWRVFFLSLRWFLNLFAKNKKFSFRFEKYLHVAWFIFLIVIMILITIKDIIKI